MSGGIERRSITAQLHDWNVAPYTSKADDDANFKRMLEFACQPENARVVNVGVGSYSAGSRTSKTERCRG